MPSRRRFIIWSSPAVSLRSARSSRFKRPTVGFRPYTAARGHPVERSSRNFGHVFTWPGARETRPPLLPTWPRAAKIYVRAAPSWGQKLLFRPSGAPYPRFECGPSHGLSAVACVRWWRTDRPDAVFLVGFRSHPSLTGGIGRRKSSRSVSRSNQPASGKNTYEQSPKTASGGIRGQHCP